MSCSILLKNLLKKTKLNFYKERVNKVKSNPKKLGNIIKELGSIKKCKTKIAKIGLKITDTISFDKLEVATHFNIFFLNIAEKLVNILPLITGKYGEEFVRQFYNSTSTLSLKQISEDKIYTMLMELEPRKATGLDGMQAKFLIDSAQSI